MIQLKDKSKEDELELLGLLIEDYNENQTRSYRLDLNPVELLKNLIEENELTQTSLADRIDISPQLMNDIIKYRREITKGVAYKLAEEFKMNIETFVRPYRLKRTG